MRILMISALPLILIACVMAAEEPAKEAPKETPKDLVPLIRFYNERTNEHCYSSAADELGAWRVAPKVKEQQIIGMVTAKELPGTTRLWRGVRFSDRRHIYYTQAPKGAAPMNAENKEFQVYVWKTGDDGRIPIYGSTWIDSTDVFFDSDRSKVRKFADDTKKALNVERPSLGQTPVFYIYPPPADAKPTTKDGS